MTLGCVSVLFTIDVHVTLDSGPAFYFIVE